MTPAKSSTRPTRRCQPLSSSSEPAPRREACAHLRRRSRSRLDAEDPRHLEGQGRARELLHHRRERASQSRSRRRILAEGHDIGNHTFTHPNLGDLPDSLVTLEINANQRLFEALTGRSMRLFRAPFLGDAEPTTSDEIVPLQIAQSMGYVTVDCRSTQMTGCGPRRHHRQSRDRTGHRSKPGDQRSRHPPARFQAAIARKRSRPCPRSSMA